MATPTYDLLASTTLTTSASSVTFSSIDQSYGDLILVTCAKATNTDDSWIAFNGDQSAGVWSRVRMIGDGSTTATASFSAQPVGYVLRDTTEFSVNIAHINDYSATDKHKTVLSRTNTANTDVRAYASRWGNTAAITSIKLDHDGSDYQVGSTFNLYGVAK